MSGQIVEVSILAECPWKKDGGPDMEKSYCREECPLRETNCRWKRKFFLWKMEGNDKEQFEKQTEQIAKAANELMKLIGRFDGHAFIHDLPRMETCCVEKEWSVEVLGATWVPSGHIAISALALNGLEAEKQIEADGGSNG